MCKKRNIYTMAELNLAMMKMYNLLNKEKFNNELPKVVITFESGYKKGAYGWIHTSKTWVQGKDDKYNINISSDFLDRPVELVIATLLHEMCHLYAMENDIQDTSRANVYHNKHFKEIAESHGLTTEHHDKVGYGVTKPTEWLQEFVKENCPIDSFKICKKRPSDKESKKSKSKQSSRKYRCPKCDLLVRATKEVSIICGNCFQEKGIPIYLEIEE